MERLTFCGTDGNAESCEPINCVDEYSSVARNICIDRLAAYEDTGLEPEEIKQMCALARLNSNIFDNDFGNHIAELIVAEQDGRLLVLPCNVGDKVFVRADTWGNTWNFVTVDCGKLLVGEIIGFSKTRKQVLMKIQVEHNVSWKKERKRYPVSALGLTVFLTREAALKAGEPK